MRALPNKPLAPPRQPLGQVVRCGRPQGDVPHFASRPRRLAVVVEVGGRVAQHLSGRRHRPDEVEQRRVADRVTMMHDGRVIVETQAEQGGNRIIRNAQAELETS